MHCPKCGAAYGTEHEPDCGERKPLGLGTPPAWMVAAVKADAEEKRARFALWEPDAEREALQAIHMAETHRLVFRNQYGRDPGVFPW